jgi:MFS family permease
MPPDAATSTRAPPAIPRGVWALGLVSLFMDVSSEMIHALLPVFLVTVLGASVTTVGFLEGVAEATASITKVFSGTWSDRLGKRKALTVLGYGLAALTKPLFALAPTTAWVFGARFADRVGKGIRGAPRDALLADLTAPEIRGAAFGLRQALDTVGAFAGPLLAIAVMALTGNRFRMVFWFAVIPAAISVALLLVFVHEPALAPAARSNRRIAWHDVFTKLGGPYWRIVAVATLFTLARFSEAFLVLKVTDVGVGPALVPIVLVVMNVVYALAAYPAGFVSDRMGRWGVLGAGAAALVVADVVLAYAGTPAAALAGVAVWGLHMGFTQGLFAALVADVARAEHRGTAFGVFNLVTGLALLVASALAGALWDAGGSRITFLAGAALTALAVVVTVALHAAGQLPRRSAG